MGTDGEARPSTSPYSSWAAASRGSAWAQSAIGAPPQPISVPVGIAVAHLPHPVGVGLTLSRLKPSLGDLLDKCVMVIDEDRVHGVSSVVDSLIDKSPSDARRDPTRYRSRSPRTLVGNRGDAQCQVKFEWSDPQVAACAAGDVGAPSAASGTLAWMPGRNSSKKIRARSSRRLWVPVFSKIDLR